MAKTYELLQALNLGDIINFESPIGKIKFRKTAKGVIATMLSCHGQQNYFIKLGNIRQVVSNLNGIGLSGELRDNKKVYACKYSA